MKKWGGTLFFFGVGSIVLYYLNMEFIVLAWVDHWGQTIGWTIRIGLIVIGGLMWLLGKQAEKPA
ncbi:MAG: hypothetical protein ACRET4_14900 [Steroidobacteraceae bacterium]